MESKRKPVPSARKIAELLCLSGWTPEAAGAIRRYWMYRTGLTERQVNQIRRLKTELSELAHGLTEGQRQVLGRFIGLQKKLSFDMGLRMGLATKAQDENVLVEPSEHED